MKKTALLSVLAILLLVVTFAPACIAPVEFREVDGNIVTDCYGSLVPCANTTYDLGSSTVWWRQGFIRDLYSDFVITNTATIGNLIVTNDATIGNDLDIGDDLIVGDDASISDNLTVGNDLVVIDDTRIGGDLTVLGSLNAPHAPTHTWQASDEIDIRDIMMQQASQYIAGFDDNTTYIWTIAAGSIWWNYAESAVNTAAAAGDTTGLVNAQGNWFDKDWNGGLHRLATNRNQYTTTANCEAWWGFFTATNIFPVVASNHVGWRLLENGGLPNNAGLYASSGNGTAGVQTLVVSNIGAWVSHSLYFEYQTDAIRYYVDGVLVATHTHGVASTPTPDNATLFGPGFWGRTTDAVVKQSAAGAWRYMRGL